MGTFKVEPPRHYLRAAPRPTGDDFDVGFDVDAQPQRVTTNHTDRGSGGRRTAPDDMGHDGTVFQAQYFKSAALPLSYAGVDSSTGHNRPGIELRTGDRTA